MTTSKSSLRALKAQADSIAKMLKDTERDGTASPAAKAKDAIRVGIVMDDKIITMDISWKTIHDISELALSTFIVDHMRRPLE